jgi:hypothetical protein
MRVKRREFIARLASAVAWPIAAPNSRAIAYGDILPCARRRVGALPAISPSNTLRM